MYKILTVSPSQFLFFLFFFIDSLHCSFIFVTNFLSVLIHVFWYFCFELHETKSNRHREYIVSKQNWNMTVIHVIQSLMLLCFWVPAVVYGFCCFCFHCSPALEILCWTNNIAIVPTKETRNDLDCRWCKTDSGPLEPLSLWKNSVMCFCMFDVKRLILFYLLREFLGFAFCDFCGVTILFLCMRSNNSTSSTQPQTSKTSSIVKPISYLSVKLSIYFS